MEMPDMPISLARLDEEEMLNHTMHMYVGSGQLENVKKYLAKEGTLFADSFVCVERCRGLKSHSCGHYRETMLMAACMNKHYLIAQLLLTKGGCNPSQACIRAHERRGRSSEVTPLVTTLKNGSLDIFKLLLAHGADIRPKAARTDGIITESYLSWIVFANNTGRYMDWLIATRWSDLSAPPPPDADPNQPDIKHAVKVMENAWKNTHMTPSHLEKSLTHFLKDPRRAGADMCRDLGFISQLYALVVLFCDGYFCLKKRTGKQLSKRARFLGIVGRLPIELQMTICHKVYDSTRERVTIPEFEEGARGIVLMVLGPQPTS